MATIQDLPEEILERILSCNDLRAKDLYCCSQAIPEIRNLCRNERFWLRKLKLRYPNVLNKVQELKKCIKPHELFEILCDLESRLSSAIMSLSHVFVWSLYHDYEWPDIPSRSLSLYLNLFDNELSHEVGLCYVMDETYNIITSGDRHKNLTLKYYAQKVYHFVNVYVNFDSIWDPVSINPKQASCKNCITLHSSSIDFFSAATRLAMSIPMHLRINEDVFSDNLNSLYNFLEEKIKESCPSILKDIARVNHLETAGKNISVYSKSQCTFLMQQIHFCLYHKFKFSISNASVYKGHMYCLDKVLLTNKGSQKMLITLEAHLAQRYGVCFELHEFPNDTWKILYKFDDGSQEYYICHQCDDQNRCNLSPALPVVITTETEFQKSILGTLVRTFEAQLNSEWELAGGPTVFDLLVEDTFSHQMRQVFNAWRFVEHWKIACLRHYTLLLQRVSSDRRLTGKILHLNLLLRVRSQQTLDALINFRREIVNPPPGIRDLQRMVASVNIRARARHHELIAMIKSRIVDNTFFLDTFHPNQIRPWPQGWAGSDMVQKRRVDRKSWHVQYAVGQIMEICRSQDCSSLHINRSFLSEDSDDYRSMKEDLFPSSSRENNAQKMSIDRKMSKSTSASTETSSRTNFNLTLSNQPYWRFISTANIFIPKTVENKLVDMSIFSNIDRCALKRIGPNLWKNVCTHAVVPADKRNKCCCGTDLISPSTSRRLNCFCSTRLVHEDKLLLRPGRNIYGRGACASGVPPIDACSCGTTLLNNIEKEKSVEACRSLATSLGMAEKVDESSCSSVSQDSESSGFVKILTDSSHSSDDSTDEPPRKVDRRTDNVTGGGEDAKLAKPTPVGKRAYGYCVIYDWDSMCVESEETLQIMGETDLRNGMDQPFYKVLLDDGSSSYVAQENLRHARNPRPISNPLLGRYFRAYVHPYYIPNMQKAYEYPEDAAIREQDSFVLSLL